MRLLPTLAILAAFSTAALAQAPASDQDHAAHHPDAASAPASAAKKAPAKSKTTAVRPKVAPTSASAASGGMGMGMGGADMQKMHDEMHKPGGMHDQMHGKDGKMMQGGANGAMGGMPAASAASK